MSSSTKKSTTRNSTLNVWWKRSCYAVLTIITLFFIIHIIIPAFTPIVFDAVQGDGVVTSHIRETVGNQTNPDNIAYRLLDWGYSNFDDPYSSWEGRWYNRLRIYRMNESYIWFIRSNELSWLIEHPLGNCGEQAYYFVQMMNETNHLARVVCVVEDHCWAEYKSDGFWIAADPTKGMHVTPSTFGAGKNWSRMEARYLNGSTEDVTYRYLNTSTISVEADNDGGIINIYSTALSSGGSERYKKPSLVASERLESPFLLNLGSLPTYEIRYEKVYGPVSFQIEYTNVSLPATVNIPSDDLIRLRNIRPNLWTLAVLLGLLIWVTLHTKDR